jgi:hypothetical protein
LEKSRVAISEFTIPINALINASEVYRGAASLIFKPFVANYAEDLQPTPAPINILIKYY